MKKAKVPAWIAFDAQKIEAKIVKLPVAEDVQLPSDVTTVFEHYSR
jgi:ribosomal protein S4